MGLRLMLFGKLLFPLVMTDRKVMTRRPVKPGEFSCRYLPGRDYAVQPGRGKPSEGRIRIESVRREALGDIGDLDAYLEGFDNREAFLAYWERMYGKVDLAQSVWALRFTRIRTDQRPDQRG